GSIPFTGSTTIRSHLAVQKWPMKYPEILSLRSERESFSYTDKDTMLYALSLGYGADPLDPRELSFVYEDGLRPVPTMNAILGKGSTILADGGINMQMLLHGEERLRIHKPLPPRGNIAARGRV